MERGKKGLPVNENKWVEVCMAIIHSASVNCQTLLIDSLILTPDPVRIKQMECETVVKSLIEQCDKLKS